MASETDTKETAPKIETVVGGDDGEGPIQVYKGDLPRCKYCHERLKPNYDTIWESTSNRTGRRLVKLTKLDMQDATPPTLVGAPSIRQDARAGTVLWNPRNKKWYAIEVYAKVVKQVFLGTFGPQHDSLFCSTQCGHDYAVRMLEQTSE